MNADKVESIYPLAPQQQGIYLESRASSNSGVYIEQLVRTLHGVVDVMALERAWQHVIASHPMLRTAFVWKGQEEPLQVVLRNVVVELAQVDWRLYSLQERRARLEEFLETDRQRGFQLHRPPLARMTLIRTEESAYELVQTFHHILVDGWSVPLINQDLAGYYKAIRNGENPPVLSPVPYRDYVLWLKRQDATLAQEFWRSRMADRRQPTPLGRISDWKEISDASQTYDTLESQLSETATEAIQALARRCRVTVNTVIQGAWALLLSRYSGEQDVVFGTTVSGRPSELSGIESTIGLFVNTLPFRVEIPCETALMPWLQSLQTRHLQLRQFEYCSTGQIHQWSEMPAAVPMFESVLVYENYPNTQALSGSNGGITEDVQASRGFGAKTRYAVVLLAALHKRLSFRIVFDRRRFVSKEPFRMLEHFVNILNHLATDPDCLLSTLLATIPGNQIPSFLALNAVEKIRVPEIGASAPRTPTETVLMNICGEVLGVAHVGIFDNLLELGAHSLIITQMVARIRNVLRTELPLSTIFDTPTIAGLARILDAQHLREDRAKPPALQRMPGDRPLPLSFAQQRLWLLDQLNPGQITYNITSRIGLVGPLDLAAVEYSFTVLVARHEALRTVFSTLNEEPIQVVQPPGCIQIPCIDLRSLPDAEKQEEVERLAKAEAERPFDLSRDLMLRATVVSVEEQKHLVLLSMHHIASDRWSIEVLLRELKALYGAHIAGLPSPLPELPIQYSDYAIWEREALSDTVYASHLDYWRKQLRDVSFEPLLATDYPRGEQPGQSGASHTALLAKPQSEALQAFTRQEYCSQYMTLLAALHILLRYHSGRDTIVTGTNVANRTHLELEGLIGFFVNQIVMRSDFTGDPTFREYLRSVRGVVLEGYAHQELPFDLLVADQKRGGTLNLTPLFQILFVQNTPIQPAQQSGLTILPPRFDTRFSRFDLAIFTGETEAGTVFEWQFKTDLFSPATITRLASQLVSLLETIAANPEIRLADLNKALAEIEGRQRQSENRARAALGKSLFKQVSVKTVTFQTENTE